MLYIIVRTFVRCDNHHHKNKLYLLYSMKFQSYSQFSFRHIGIDVDTNTT